MVESQAKRLQCKSTEVILQSVTINTDYGLAELVTVTLETNHRRLQKQFSLTGPVFESNLKV